MPTERITTMVPKFDGLSYEDSYKNREYLEDFSYHSPNAKFNEAKYIHSFSISSEEHRFRHIFLLWPHVRNTFPCDEKYRIENALKYTHPAYWSALNYWPASKPFYKQIEKQLEDELINYPKTGEDA